MTLDEFLARLSKVKKTGGKWQARCPSHEDGTASLGIAEGSDGRILLTCRAGCETKDVVATLGLELKDLFSDSGSPRPSTPAPTREPSPAPEAAKERRRTATRPFSERVAATYDYVDEEGNLLYQAVRLADPKDFRQRQQLPGHPSADKEGWVWSLGNEEKGIPAVRRVPYRLPEILAAAAEGRAVWIAEGEKDVDALVEMGFVATCNPMGAGEGKWPDEFSEFFDGCAWVIAVADCDPPGRKHAHAVCRSFFDAGHKVKMLDLARDRDDGFDVFDFAAEYWIEAADMLRDLAKTSRRWTPDLHVSARAPTVSARAFREAVGEYDPSREYLGPFLYGGERVHVIGPVNQGKSTFIQEAMSAALHGVEFLGWRGTGAPLRGVLIDLEQPAHALHRGIADARLYDPALDGRFDVWHEPDGLAIDQNHQHREMLVDLVSRYDVVAIDPWYKLIAEELSDGMRNVRPVISFLDGLRKRHPRTVIVCGRHTNEKEKGHKLELGDASGYKAYERAADITLGFQRLGGDRSRLVWLKTRSHLLPKLGETWLVEWTRGTGFRRVEQRKSTDQVEELLTDEWQSTWDIAEAWERKPDYAARVLNQLVAEERAECRGSSTGGRGQTKFWRRANVDQGVIDVAA